MITKQEVLKLKILDRHENLIRLACAMPVTSDTNSGEQQYYQAKCEHLIEKLNAGVVTTYQDLRSHSVGLSKALQSHKTMLQLQLRDVRAMHDTAVADSIMEEIEDCNAILKLLDETL